MDIFLNKLIQFYLNNTSPLNSTHYIVLYPQNGDPFVTIDSVTSLHPRYRRLQKLDNFFSGILSQTVDFGNISSRQGDRRKRCQLSSTGERWQFITLSVHFCVQHYRRGVSRRAGQSVAADVLVIMELVLFQDIVDTSTYKYIRYDTRCDFNVRSKANMSQLNLPHGTDS